MDWNDQSESVFRIHIQIQKAIVWIQYGYGSETRFSRRSLLKFFSKNLPVQCTYLLSVLFFKQISKWNSASLFSIPGAKSQKNLIKGCTGRYIMSLLYLVYPGGYRTQWRQFMRWTEGMEGILMRLVTSSSSSPRSCTKTTTTNITHKYQAISKAHTTTCTQNEFIRRRFQEDGTKGPSS